MFESSNGDFDIQKNHINGKGDWVVTAGLSNNGILGKTDIQAKLFRANTFTVDMFGAVFYRQFPYKLVTHARVFSLSPKNLIIDQRQGLFIASSMMYLRSLFGYGNMCSWEKIKDKTIFLPVTKDDNIDSAFIDTFLRELERERLFELERERLFELEAYLEVTGLKDYTLTEEEKNTLDKFNRLKWQAFNVKDLFGDSTRGKRLKSEDRIPGTLPFVTAGEVNTGISDFIGNGVTVFSSNTTTIDMFGSAKYRNYEYGADDHVAVVHTEKLKQKSAIFVTSACHKAAHTGKFNYGHNFYAKDADELYIMLPVCEDTGLPDYAVMEQIVSAVQKIVIADVAEITVRDIETTRQIISK